MRMKNCIFLCAAASILTVSACAQSSAYKDGVFEGKSRAFYTSEPYWGNATVTVEKGKIKAVDFKIIDTAKKEVFDEKYERHYAGIQAYIDQCRNEVKALKIYPGQFLEKQDLKKVDAISGATWSYNLFKSAVKNALDKAKK